MAISPEKIELVLSLLRRDNRREDAQRALAHAYPTAPEEMRYTAIFHMYVDGVGALADVLADAELVLREPGRQFDSGGLYHLVYHMYNLMQFLEVLPLGKPGLMKALQDLKEGVAAEDELGIKNAADLVESILTGGLDPPTFQK